MNKFSIVLILAFVFAVASQSNADLSACGICTMVVDSLEGFLSSTIARDELVKDLAIVSKTVCDSVPSEMLSKEKCNSFVSLYGPYTIDLLLSKTKPQEICGDLGLCDSKSSKYKIIFPTIEFNTVTYSAVESNYQTETEFNYKIFLGTPEFLDNDTYALSVMINNISGSDVVVRVTNETNFVTSDYCTEHKHCSLDITRPGKGLWYYITVNVKTSSDKTSFTLSMNEQNWKVGTWEYIGSHHNNLYLATLILVPMMMVCIICMAITRCIFQHKPNNSAIDLDSEEFLLDPNYPPFYENVNGQMLVFVDPNMMYNQTPQYVSYEQELSR